MSVVVVAPKAEATAAAVVDADGAGGVVGVVGALAFLRGVLHGGGVCAWDMVAVVVAVVGAADVVGGVGDVAGAADVPALILAALPNMRTTTGGAAAAASDGPLRLLQQAMCTGNVA